MIDLDTLAALGEFLGGLAVLVSLVYLVVSIRQNTNQLGENQKTLQRIEQRATYEQHDRYRLATLEPGIAELWLKGLADELTEPADRFRYSNLMLMMTYSTENNWELMEEELGDAWERIAKNTAATYNTPGGNRWWMRTRETFKPGFVESIEQHRHTAES